MNSRKLIAVVAALAGVLGTGGAIATAASAPATTTIKAVHGPAAVKINRYLQDGLRWDKDVYTVKSGGTLRIVNDDADEGPHTFTVATAKDLPRSAAQIARCPICEKLGKAHGADPNSDAPPKFQYLENGVGQNTAPDVDRPGDSGVTGPGKKGESITLKVTAPKGTVLRFICLIHPWMQAKVLVR